MKVFSFLKIKRIRVKKALAIYKECYVNADLKAAEMIIYIFVFDIKIQKTIARKAGTTERGKS